MHWQNLRKKYRPSYLNISKFLMKISSLLKDGGMQSSRAISNIGSMIKRRPYKVVFASSHNFLLVFFFFNFYFKFKKQSNFLNFFAHNNGIVLSDLFLSHLLIVKCTTVLIRITMKTAIKSFTSASES